MLAHDLRSPISAQHRFLSIMHKNFDCIPQEELQELLGQMQQQSYQMLQMINNVLDSYRYDSNALKVRCGNVNLMTLLRECVLEMQPMFEAGSLELKLTGLAVKSVQADKTALRRVICNLLGNALKFTKAGGKVQVQLFEKGAHTFLRVVDNGIGIEAENLERIFDKLWQEQKGYRSNGLGLGLYICRQILEAQGSKISCQSLPGVGTTFEIVLNHSNSVFMRLRLGKEFKPKQYFGKNASRCYAVHK